MTEDSGYTLFRRQDGSEFYMCDTCEPVFVQNDQDAMIAHVKALHEIDPALKSKFDAKKKFFEGDD